MLSGRIRYLLLPWIYCKLNPFFLSFDLTFFFVFMPLVILFVCAYYHDSNALTKSQMKISGAISRVRYWCYTPFVFVHFLRIWFAIVITNDVPRTMTTRYEDWAECRRLLRTHCSYISETPKSNLTFPMMKTTIKKKGDTKMQFPPPSLRQLFIYAVLFCSFNCKNEVNFEKTKKNFYKIYIKFKERANK